MSLIQKAAIFGAAGAIGHAVAPELERRGIPFRVVGRSRARLEAAFSNFPHAEIFDADLSDLRAAGAAARGVDTIIYTAGLPYPSHQLHPTLMRTTIAAAASVAAQRIVLISSVYPYGVPRAARVAETHPREPVARKGQYRKEQEDALFEAHKKGQVQGMVIRLPTGRMRTTAWLTPSSALRWRAKPRTGSARSARRTNSSTCPIPAL